MREGMKDMNHGDAATRSETLLSDVRNSAIPISWVHTSRRGKEGGREPQRPHCVYYQEQ